MFRVQICRVLATVLFLVPTAMLGQSSLGQLTGAVTDTSGAPIVGAHAKVRDVSTNVQSQSITSSDGLFNIISLVPGDYQLIVDHEGFETSITNKVTISAGQITTVNAALKVGSISTKVEVTATATMLTTGSSEVATTVERSLVSNLPFTERNSLEAAMLIPGVRGDPNSPGQVVAENAGIYTGNISPGAATNIAGGMPGSTSIMVDGSSVIQPSIGRAAISVSGDMVQEVTVVTNGVPARYGNTGGGVIIQATRSGTNEYHGNFAWKHTDPGFNAYPTGNAIGNEQHQNFFGGYAGGPVFIPKIYNGKNRTFFFGGFEPARLYNATSANSLLPTPDELAGKFNNSLSLINTTILSSQGLAAALAAPRVGGLYYQSPVNAAGFSSGPQYASTSLYQPIPNNDVSAQLAQNKFAKYLMGLQPTPANPGPFVQFLRPDGLYNSSSYNAVIIRGVTNTDDRFSTRVDHNFSDKDRIFARLAVQPLTATRFFGYPINSPLTSYPTDNASSYVISLDETHILTPSIVNELKIMYVRNHQVRGQPAAALSQDFAAAYGLTPAVAGAGFPKIGWSGYGLQPGTSGNEQVDTNYQFEDSVNWTVGRHSIAFGADLRRMLSNQYNPAGVNGGTYNFSANQTNNGSGGNGLASFDLGLINTYTNTPVQVPGYYRWNYAGAYFQDDIKVLPTLTLNVGMRYEFQTPRMEKFGNQGTFLPNVTGTLNGMPAKGAFCFAENCGLGKTLWPSNFMGFEPRIGIAWAPNSKMTVRANYGIMRVPLTGYGNTPLPDFNVNSFSVGGTTGGTAPNQPVNYITNPIAGPLTSAYTALQGRGPFFTVQGITVPYIAQTDKVPYVQQWGLTLQTMLDSKTLVQVGYAGTVGHHLISSASPPLNFPDLPTLFGNVQSGANFSGSNISNPYGIVQNGAVIKESLLQSLNPYQNFFNQALQQQFYRDGNSIYHALLGGVTRRLANGLTFQASFTWSKSIDDAGGSPAVALSGSIFGTATVQNPFNLRLERAVSNFDTPVRTTVGYSYQLPIGSGKLLHTNNKILDAVLGGWVTSGVFNSQSGMPFLDKAGSAGYWVSSTGVSVLPSGVLLRPDVVPGQPCVNPAFSFTNAFNVPYENPNAVAIPGSYLHPAFGNAPRTLTGCRSPWLNSLNASLQKRFRLGSNERRYLQINLDALNALSHTLYFFNPNSGMNAYNGFNASSLTNPAVPAFTQQSTYGELWQPNSALVSRTVFVGAKLYW